MSNPDRVSDLYYGRIDSPETQMACRDRIHWLCRQAKGPRILDVGCSQGIVSILLGREGHEVLGIDPNADSIEFARQALATEPESFRSRVRFEVCDVFQANFGEGEFDSVVIGELLELLVSPDILLAQAARWLRPGGQIVISVPLGFFPTEGNKRSYYFGNLLELIGGEFSLTHCTVVHGRYICAVAVRPPAGERPAMPARERISEWLRDIESNLEQSQRRSWEAVSTFRLWRSRMNAQLTRLRRELAHFDTLQKLHKNEELLRAQAERRIQDIEARLTQSEAERVSALSRVAEFEAQLKRGEDVVRSRFEAEIVRLQSDIQRIRSEAESDSLRREFDATRVKSDLERQLVDLNSRLDTEARKRRAAERKTQFIQESLESTREVLNVRMNEVRYKLGDALVRAFRPSRDTILLPFRILDLLVEGLKKRRARKQGILSGGEAQAAGSLAAGVSSSRTAVKPRPLPEWLSTLEPAAHLDEPYSAVPPGQVNRPNLRIAGVMDEFSWRAWQYEADLYTFTPDGWWRALEEKTPHVLLVESTWKGIDNAWHYQVRELGAHPGRVRHYVLPDIIAWCRKRGIPTVFYNKEDPPNFEFFIEAARLFDYVFTSDADCIPDYVSRVGHDRVFALPFAAQPRIHNPVSAGERIGNVCFAGTWYNHRHLERQSGAEAILKPAIDFGFYIFDRMAESGHENYRWPDIYHDCIYGSLPYSRMVTAYKRFKLFLNINSVTDSPTMFARRVFELLASGTPVVSSESRGIRELLGADLVHMSADEASTRSILSHILTDDEFRERLSLRGQRKVFSEHTYAHRLEFILKTVGIQADPVERPFITVVAGADSPEQAENVWNSFERQTYDRCRLVLVTPLPAVATAFERLAAPGGRASVVCVPGAAYGALFADVIEKSDDGEWLANMSAGDFYGANYFCDYANAMTYVESDAIGKSRHYTVSNGDQPRMVSDGVTYQYTRDIRPCTLCMRVRSLRAKIDQLKHCADLESCWKAMQLAFDRVFAADAFNYVRRLAVSHAPESSAVEPECVHLESDQQQLAHATV